jgi:hypothetical protein
MKKPNNNKPSGSGKQQRAHPIQGSKEFTIIQHLLLGNSLHRFEAEALADHYLHSTISIIARKYGLEIPRQWKTFPNRFGSTIRVKRYWFNKSDIVIIFRHRKGWSIQRLPM